DEGFSGVEPGVALYAMHETNTSAPATAMRTRRMELIDKRMPLVDHGCPSQCIAKRYIAQQGAACAVQPVRARARDAAPGCLPPWPGQARPRPDLCDTGWASQSIPCPLDSLRSAHRLTLLATSGLTGCQPCFDLRKQ